MLYIPRVLVMRGLLFVLVVVALAAVILSLLRRNPRSRADDPPDGVEPDARDEHAAPSDPPAALPPPAADAAAATAPASKALERAEVFRKLEELALGAALEPTVSAEHAKANVAIAVALETAATDPRYSPRRPLLLPQLMSAVGDSDTSRGELAGMIARDPALVGGLLRLANSPVYRRTAQPVESVERAVTVMGTQGIRSLIAAALVQPVFRASGVQGKFPEVIWEYTHRAAAAAEVHAQTVENDDPFAAQLLVLVTGLAAIVVFRVAADQYAQRAPLRADATAIAALLDDLTADVALRIAASWELSARVLEALEDQRRGKSALPASALGRSLKFGLVVGALSVLQSNGAIDAETGTASLVAAGGIGPKFERMWERLTKTAEDATA